MSESTRRFTTLAEFHYHNNAHREAVLAAGLREDADPRARIAGQLVAFANAKSVATRYGQLCNKDPFVAAIMASLGLSARPLPAPASTSEATMAERHALVAQTEARQRTGTGPEARIAAILDRFFERDASAFRRLAIIDTDAEVGAIVDILSQIARAGVPVGARVPAHAFEV